MLKKYLPFGLIFSFVFLSLGRPAAAICPVCVVAVGAGLGLSEYLGIDNSIAGLWIGGLLVALSLWTINYFQSKRWTWGNTYLRDISIFILYYALTIWPLWSQNLIGQASQKLFGMDKLIFGIIVGSLLFVFSNFSYEYLKKRNQGKAYFPFQKVAMPIASLLIFSFIFYFLTA